VRNIGQQKLRTDPKSQNIGL